MGCLLLGILSLKLCGVAVQEHDLHNVGVVGFLTQIFHFLQYKFPHLYCSHYHFCIVQDHYKKKKKNYRVYTNPTRFQ